MINRSSPTSKRGRRGRAEIEGIRVAIARVLLADKPMTVRQVFHRLVSTGVIDTRVDRRWLNMLPDGQQVLKGFPTMPQSHA